MSPKSEHIARELLAIGFRAYPRNLSNGFMFAALTVALMWPGVPHDLLLAWLCVFAMLILVRFAIAHAYLGSPPPGAELDAWANRAALTYGAAGLLWGTIGAAGNNGIGVTGVNFGVAETGSICLVTNEGNGRLVTSLPRVHVAVMGMERVVPTLEDLSVLLQLLLRSAGGQKLSVYTTLLTGPRRKNESDGPEELHVVIIDNGRSNLRGGRYEEMLNCIRCGACLNVCPVYRKAGGGAYSDVYSGPMGAVLVPLLAKVEHAPSLPHASSLCGACTESCPVKIPLHELLLELRRDLVDEGIASRRERLGFLLWSLAWSNARTYRLSARLARRFTPLAARFGPGRNWSKERELPRFASRSYREL